MIYVFISYKKTIALLQMVDSWGGKVIMLPGIVKAL
jgi:hypothetical protein